MGGLERGEWTSVRACSSVNGTLQCIGREERGIRRNGGGGEMKQFSDQIYLEGQRKGVLYLGSEELDVKIGNSWCWSSF